MAQAANGVVRAAQADSGAMPLAPQPNTFQCVLDDRWAIYLRELAARMARKRGVPITPGRCLELILREHWRKDEDRLLATAGHSGPAGAFVPGMQAWRP